MAAKLPDPIAAYLEAANSQNVEGVVACFAGGSIVRDEGRERRGIAAIREWVEEVSRKYQPRAVVIDRSEAGGRIVVTARVSGRFPGSPIDLRYAFTLEGPRIARLEISA